MKSIFMIAIGLLSTAIIAQDYQISFAVLDDEEAIVDSVVIRNLTQDHTITLQGGDILHLLASPTGENPLKYTKDGLEIYPNPFSDRAEVIFQNQKEGLVEITLSDMAGKMVAQKHSLQAAGKISSEIRGLPAGAYVLQIGTEASTFSEVILSNASSVSHPEIHIRRSEEDPDARASFKSSGFSADLVEMQYNEGDTLSLTAYKGGLVSEMKFVPVETVIISFEFLMNLDDISTTAVVTIEGGLLELSDESGNMITVTFPPGAVMDTVEVFLTILGEPKSLPINERQLRVFEIRPLDVNLYEPVSITIEYQAPLSNIEETAIFRVRSGEWLPPLSNLAYSDDLTSVTASTYILGDFAEGKMNLEEINTQFDLSLAYIGETWEASTKVAGREKQMDCDTRMFKALWDDWRESIGAFVSIFRQRYLLGYYNDLKEGQPSYEEEQELLCEIVVSMAVNDVLDFCTPEDLCDRDYTHTISSMAHDMQMLGCDDTTFNNLQARFDQMLLDCGSYLSISSVLDIRDGGLKIETKGIVPITTRLQSDKTAIVEGAGTLAVTGDSNEDGSCTATVSGQTQVTVIGNRSAALSYNLSLATKQDALLTTVCPKVRNETPLIGEDIYTDVILSTDNGYVYYYETDVDEGVFQMEVILYNPYITPPYEE